MLVLCLGAAFALGTNSCRDKGEAAKSELKQRGYDLTQEEFFRAAESDDVKALDELIKGGIAVDTRNAEGNTALHAAALAGMKKSVDFLIEHGLPIDVTGEEGRTPLMATVLEGTPAMARYLLSKRADSQKKDAHGYKSMALAVTRGQPGMVAELAPYDRENLDAALLMAALEGRASAIDELTQYGASVYARMDDDGRTALMVASENGNVEAVEMLLNLGANRFAMDEQGRIAADYAREAGHGELANLLTEQPKQDEFGFDEPSDLGAEMLAIMAAADAKNGMTGESQEKPVPPPSDEKSGELPWNKPIAGQGGGAFGALPGNAPSPELEGAVLSVVAPEQAANATKPQPAPFVMRLYRQKELPLRIESVEGEVATLRMAGGGTSQVNTGATVPGSRLKLLRVETRVQHIKDSAQDTEQVAVARLEDATTGETRDLISGLSSPSHDPVALVEDAAGKRYIARAGQKFRTAAGEEFTVIDVRPNQMVVENRSKSEVITVPLRGPRG